jgi:hypothetical protein
MDSRDFYTIKPPWVADFGTVIKNSKLFRFRHDVEDYSRENFELVHTEPALKIFLTARSKIKKGLLLFLNPFASSKNDFKSLLFGYFLLVLKNSKLFSFYRMFSLRSHFVTACSACVGILLPHAQLA